MLQTIIVFLIIIAAALFTVSHIRRKFSAASSGCGGCGCASTDSCAKDESRNCEASKTFLEKAENYGKHEKITDSS